MVVVSGNKTGDDGTVIPSPGVDEEVKIALRLGKPVSFFTDQPSLHYRRWT